MNHVRAFLISVALVLVALSCHWTPHDLSGGLTCDQEDIMVGDTVTFILTDVDDPDGDAIAVLYGYHEEELMVKLGVFVRDGPTFTLDHTFTEAGRWGLSVGVSRGLGTVFKNGIVRYVDADGVYIYDVAWAPLEDDEVELRNGSLAEQDISGWTVGDVQAPTAYTIPDGTVLQSKEHLSIQATQMEIEITQHEVVYLRDATGAEIDTWGE